MITCHRGSLAASDLGVALALFRSTKMRRDRLKGPKGSSRVVTVPSAVFHLIFYYFDGSTWVLIAPSPFRHHFPAPHTKLRLLLCERYGTATLPQTSLNIFGSGKWTAPDRSISRRLSKVVIIPCSCVRVEGCRTIKKSLVRWLSLYLRVAWPPLASSNTYSSSILDSSSSISDPLTTFRIPVWSGPSEILPCSTTSAHRPTILIGIRGRRRHV